MKHRQRQYTYQIDKITKSNALQILQQIPVYKCYHMDPALTHKHAQAHTSYFI